MHLPYRLIKPRNVEENSGKKNVYFVRDSNGRWLKDSTFLCCINVILNVESRIALVIKVRCLL